MNNASRWAAAALVSVITIFPYIACGQQSISEQLQTGEFWERIHAIRSVEQFDDEQLLAVFPTIVSLLADEDQSIRVSAAAAIKAKPRMPEIALPALYANFDQPHGEEGLEYVHAVVAYGDRAVSSLCDLQHDSSSLTRERAQDSLKLIERNSKQAITCETLHRQAPDLRKN